MTFNLRERIFRRSSLWLFLLQRQDELTNLQSDGKFTVMNQII